MNLGIRFFISWILTALVMFTLFYYWHGVILNDFKRLNFPLTVFIVFASITYLILGAGMYFLFESSLLKYFHNFFVRGLITGVIGGISLFMIVTVINISLTKDLNPTHLLIDCSWQIAEQTIGAIILVLLKVFIRDKVPVED
ncbi:MAG: hypothetical protein LCH32_08255 [Bacteroidetes bacterium]|nr:hypothetical protein [Bacteroidota bacterium]